MPLPHFVVDTTWVGFILCITDSSQDMDSIPPPLEKPLSQDRMDVMITLQIVGCFPEEVLVRCSPK